MSANFSAMALIGLKVEKSKLYTKQKVKAFEHSYSNDMLFCPKTGKKLWAFEEVPVLAFEDEETIAGYRVVSGTDGEPFYVCLDVADDTYSNGGNDDHMVSITAFQPRLYDFLVKMEDLGLWDQTKFGLWAVLYCSY